MAATNTSASSSSNDIKRLHLNHIRPEDIATLADPNITALTVPEVLTVSQVIDHQLLTLKHGILGSDVEPFLMNLIATSLGPSGARVFFRTPTSQELRLCRRLAQVEEEDIVTQMQLLRMLDVFCKLTRIYQRASTEAIVEMNQDDVFGSASSPTLGPGGLVQLPAALEAVVDLSKDIQASTSALTEDSVFASSNFEGVVPACVIYELAHMYGLDARSWFHRQSAMTMLPSGDETVVALRTLLDRQKAHAASQHQPVVNAKKITSGMILSPRAAQQSSIAASPLSASPTLTSRQPTVVPVEFITTAAVSDAFAPLNEKVLKLFIKTFGASDPNDPTNELGLDLVDGHLMLTLPVKQFASVLQLTQAKALKLICAALEGVPNPSSTLNPAWSSIGINAAKRRMSTIPGAGQGGSQGYAVNWDEVDDVFETGLLTGTTGLQVTNSGNFNSSGTAFPSPAASYNNKRISIATTPPSTSLVHQSHHPHQHMSGAASSIAIESLPVDFPTVVQRGHLRYPEFELIIKFLGGKPAVPFQKQRDAQQSLVDAVVAASNGGGNVRPPDAVRSVAQKAPDSETEKRIMDEQARFFEAQLFAAPSAAKQKVAALASSKSSAVSGAPSAVASDGGDHSQIAVASQPSSGATATAAAVPIIGGNTTSIDGNAKDCNAASVTAPSIVQIQSQPAAGAAQGSSTAAAHRHQRRHERGNSPPHGKRHAHSPEGSKSGRLSSPTLRGWPIHPHNAERLDRRPYNGRDSQRLERSVITSSDRTVLSFATGDGSSGTGAGRHSSATAVSVPSTSNAVNPVVSLGITGALPSATDAALGGSALSGEGARGASLVATNAVQRALMSVIDLQQMQRVLAAIPDEVPGNNILQGVAHAAFTNAASVMGVGSHGVVGTVSFLHNSSSTAGGVGALSMLNPHEFEEPLDLSRRGGAGQRSSTKSQLQTSTTAGSSSSMAKSFNGVRPSASDEDGASGAADMNSILVASTGNNASLRTPRSVGPAAALVSPNANSQTELTVVVPPGSSADGQMNNGEASDINGEEGRTRSSKKDGQTKDGQQTSSPTNNKSHGIHAQPWRSVLFIPKLKSESIDTYCSIQKRSGGGFGVRGRSPPTSPQKSQHSEPTPQQNTSTQALRSTNGNADFAGSLKSESGGGGDNSQPRDLPNEAEATVPLQGENSKPKRPQRPVVDLLSRKATAGEQKRSAAAPTLPTIRSPRGTNNAKDDAVAPAPAVSARDAARALVADSAPPPAKRLPKPEAVPASQVSARCDPILEPQPPSRRKAPKAPQQVAVSQQSAPQTTSRPQAASPRKSVVSSGGFMAVMDPLKSQHVGGSMLSFIPPALAADVLATLDLRFTYPPTGVSGNTAATMSSARPAAALPPPMRNPVGLEPLPRPPPARPAGENLVAREPLHAEHMQRQKEEVSAMRFR